MRSSEVSQSRQQAGTGLWWPSSLNITRSLNHFVGVTVNDTEFHGTVDNLVSGALDRFFMPPESSLAQHSDRGTSRARETGQSRYRWLLSARRVCENRCQRSDDRRRTGDDDVAKMHKRGWDNGAEEAS